MVVLVVVVVVEEWEMPEQRCPSMCHTEHEERMEACRRSGDGAFRGPSRDTVSLPRRCADVRVYESLLTWVSTAGTITPRPIRSLSDLVSDRLSFLSDTSRIWHLLNFLTHFHTPHNSCTVSLLHSDDIINQKPPGATPRRNNPGFISLNKSLSLTSCNEL